MKKNKNLSFWNKAKKNILGGNMLLSKRPDLYLPEIWPTYFSKAKGINVWDLNGQKYKDCIFAVGHNILGYRNAAIDKSIKKTIDKGNMSTLNCPEEVQLSEKLLELHPWAGMVKFAKTGGEANAISVRIARAASKKDRIAICGYHGWHDWYLSLNLNNRKNLNSHLLKGLNPLGVPKGLKNSIFAFNYGDLKKLKEIIKKKKIGIVKMEVCRSTMADAIFLKKVREITKKNNIILIFDECTSGFRRYLGGDHMNHGIFPDICILGKALGNGYPITAILGREKIMKKAQDSFISSTFWTERTGYVAALKTILCMNKTKSWKKIINFGRYLNKKWIELSNKYKLEIKIEGYESITSFYFLSQDHLKYKTFITQEMLKKKYLASNLFYLSVLHTKKEIDKYIKNLDPVFKKISMCEKKQLKIDNLLDTRVCSSGFSRVN